MRLKRNKNKRVPKKFKYNFIWLILLIGLVAGAFAFVKYQTKPQAKPVEKNVQIEEPKPTCQFKVQDVLTEINKVRSVPVKEDPRLSQIAQERANEMNGVLDNHAGFKTRFYNSPLPYGYIYLGENLAKIGCPLATIVVNGWLSSPPHKATMISERYDTVGIAEYKNVVVTEFGDLK